MLAEAALSGIQWPISCHRLFIVSLAVRLDTPWDQRFGVTCTLERSTMVWRGFLTLFLTVVWLYARLML